MPELADRDRRERELTAAIMVPFAEHRAAVERGEPLQIRDLQSDLEEVIAPAAEDAYTAALILFAMMMLDDAFEALSRQRIDQGAAREFGREYARTDSRELASSTAERLRDAERKDAAAEPSPQPSPADTGTADPAPEEEAEPEQTEVEKTLDKVFGEDRAKRIASTELTRITSTVEGIARGEYERTEGIVITAYWVTELDAKVCKICRPLHMRREDVWQDQFPTGPPAHPNCRCNLNYVID